MNLLELIEKHDTKNEVIIKRKKEILEFTIKAGILLKYDLSIYADSERLCIGNTTIKMIDLKKIYLLKLRNRYGGYACSLEAVGKNIMNSISITITTLSEEDLDKIGELFNYFIFSNETNYNRLTSVNYEFLIEDYPNMYEHQLNVYNEEQKDVECIIMNNKEYFFIKILPKSYVKKYSNRKYLLFETRYKNPNYMDVWIERKAFQKMINRKFILSILVSLVVFLLLIYAMLNSITDIITDLQEETNREERQEIYLQERAIKKEKIKELLPAFNIYYENGFICRDIDYEEPEHTDILCIFEFEDGEKYHRLFNKENKIDLESLSFKKGSRCKIYVTYTGTIIYEGDEEFIANVVISNSIEIIL